MSYVAHVDPDLMCPPGFKHTPHHADMAERLDYLVVCHGVFAVGIVIRQYGHLQAVFGIAAYVAFDPS